MKYNIDNNEYELIIEKKRNKHTYIKVIDGKIYVTTNYLISKKRIINLLDINQESLKKMLKRDKIKQNRRNKFYYLNQEYDVIFEGNSVNIINNIIYAKDNNTLDKWLKQETLNLFKERLDYNYNLFKENIPYPTLKIRKMKTRWGVCNRKTNTVTLNSELIKYGLEQIDYVIIHELSHFVYFDHSKNFWNEVSKYCKDYKKISKVLKET